MRYGIALAWLLALLAVEGAGIVAAALEPCAIELRDTWPLSTLLVTSVGALGFLLLRPRGLARCRTLCAWLVVASIGVADVVHARYRSTIGCLALGGVEALVRRAHRSNDRRALSCLRVVGDATQYGPDQAETYIRQTYDSSEQARLFTLMVRAVPQRAGQFF